MSAAAFTITAAAVTARPTAIRATRATMPTRGARVSQAATMKGAPDTTLSSANQITDDDVSSWEEIDRQIFAMCSKYIGDSSVNPRIMAATELNAEKTYEALDDITVVEVYQAAYDGGLDECTTIIDTHLRMLAECIIQDDVELVRSIYGKFRRLPPMLQKSSLIATAAVAEAGLSSSGKSTSSWKPCCGTKSPRPTSPRMPRTSTRSPRSSSTTWIRSSP